MPAEVQTFGDIAVTPHVLSTQAAMETYSSGGNAVDAAISANAVQGLVAPETCGIGGDLFALVWRPGDAGPSALNASGPAGSGAHAEELRRQGLQEIPPLHPITATIPGCVAGWGELAGRFGRLPLDVLLAPAIRLAEHGFPASTELAVAFAARREALSSTASGGEMYPAGRPPIRGTRIVRPLLAASLGLVAARGPTAFYEDYPGRAISDATEGRITPEDLARYRPEWVEPVSAATLGLTGWTVPPNSQGYLTLATVRVFEMLDPPDDPADPRWSHLLIEAYRRVSADGGALVSDPASGDVDAARLVADDRLAEYAGEIDPARAAPYARFEPARGGTAFMCTVDATGMACSLIQSNYWGVGSNLAVADAGFILHNRGYGFTLEPGHPNELAPGRRPRHTLSPTLWTDGERLAAVLGTRGGDQQPQVLAQMATRIFAAGQPPGHAQQAPRWAVSSDSGQTHAPILEIEPGAEAVAATLESMGHPVERQATMMRGRGPVSVITIGADGLRTGAADPRVDTAAAAGR